MDNLDGLASKARNSPTVRQPPDEVSLRAPWEDALDIRAL
jgi:hypothetical protein